MSGISRITRENCFVFLGRLDAVAMRCFLPIVCFIGALSFYIFFPGVYTWDTHFQLGEAISGHYTDWHPPIMAWWWGWLMRYIWSDPAVLLLFHLLMFWSGVYIWGRTLGTISAFWAYLCLGLWFIPPVMGMTAVLIKDTAMTCSWFLACAMMAQYYQKGRSPGVISAALIFILLFYGTAVRHNAITALPPLCLWFSLCLHGRQRGWRSTVVTAFFLFLGLFCAKIAFSAAVHTTPTRYDETLYLFDLRSTSDQLNTSLMPDYYFKYPVVHASPSGVDFLDIVQSQNPQERSQLLHAYFSMISDHPIAYFSHRWEVFRYLVRIGIPDTSKPYYWYEADNGNNATMQKLGQNWIQSYLHSTANSAWYIGAIWMVIAIGALGISILYGANEPLLFQAGLLYLSAILLMIALFFISPVAVFRYIYWLVVATYCGALMSGSYAHLHLRRKSDK